MNQNGFAIKEMVILCSVLGLFFIVAITRVSFALEDAKMEDVITEDLDHALVLAAVTYAKVNSDQFTEKETFLYGSDLIKAGFLLDIDDMDYKNTEMRIWKENDTFKAEVVK